MEHLYLELKIQVLGCTSTLAWGVNFPAHLVGIKGTEYYDAATSRYVDFPITDVLQMMGRAGRPQFDDDGVAVVLVLLVPVMLRPEKMTSSEFDGTKAGRPTPPMPVTGLPEASAL